MRIRELERWLELCAELGATVQEKEITMAGAKAREINISKGPVSYTVIVRKSVVQMPKKVIA